MHHWILEMILSFLIFLVSNRPTVVYNQVVLYSNQVVQGNFEHTFVALHAWVLAFRLSYCENMFISLSSALLLEIKQAYAHLRAIMIQSSYIKLNVWPLKQTEVLGKIEATSVIYWTFMIIDNQSLKQMYLWSQRKKTKIMGFD